MSEDVLCVFESLSHLGIITLKSHIQWKCLSLSLLVHICDQSAFTVQKNLRMILEVYLDYLVTEPEHNRMLSPHPLLHVDVGIQTDDLATLVSHLYVF